jgi:hypothetical protein
MAVLLGTEPIDNSAGRELHILAPDRRVRGNVALEDGTVGKAHR